VARRLSEALHLDIGGEGRKECFEMLLRNTSEPEDQREGILRV
jgi:hypothetical protein